MPDFALFSIKLWLQWSIPSHRLVLNIIYILIELFLLSLCCILANLAFHSLHELHRLCICIWRRPLLIGWSFWALISRLILHIVFCYVFLHPFILFSEVSILLLLVFRKLEMSKLEQSIFNFIISQLQGLEMKCLKKLRYLDIAQESVEITLVFPFSLKYS